MDRDLKQRDAYIAIAFALIFVAILCTASFVIARPFLAPLLWGVILAIATWPAFVWCRQHLGGRNTLAAALMTALLAIVLLGPLALIGMAMTETLQHWVIRCALPSRAAWRRPIFLPRSRSSDLA